MFSNTLIESALFFESPEQIYQRVYRQLQPGKPAPEVSFRFRAFASARSRIHMNSGKLVVEVSDLLADAPSPVQEALACILISKLLNRTPSAEWMSRYRRYLDRADMRVNITKIRRERGRKSYGPAKGRVYDLSEIFESINHKYFGGMMAQPSLGWSLRVSRTTLGHYDSCYHVIVLSNILDRIEAPLLAVEYVMFHEILHLRFPSTLQGARRCVHSPEFKNAERQFANYQEAKNLLNRYLVDLDEEA